MESTTNDDFGNSIHPSQSTNTTCCANNDQTNPTCHELSSNMVANENENNKSLASADALTMFQDLFQEEDLDKLDEEIYEKIRFYKT